MSLHVIPVALSPEACDLFERLLAEHIDDHARWVEENGEQRGDEDDIKLAWKVRDELQVAKSHAAPNPQRESRVTVPQERAAWRTPDEPQSQAAAIADKMAKAARKAVDDHEEKS